MPMFFGFTLKYTFNTVSLLCSGSAAMVPRYKTIAILAHIVVIVNKKDELFFH